MCSPAMQCCAGTTGPQGPGRRNNNIMHSNCRMAKIMLFAETADDLRCSLCPFAQPRQDRFNCLISKRPSEESASSALVNVKSAMERKG